ncbi:MAG TPA: hypothetical protein VFZ61_00105, partial [Polyangiales bacterium]
HTPRNIPARRLLSALGGGGVEQQRLEVNASPAQLRAFRLNEDEGPDTGVHERIPEGDVQRVQQL